MDDDLDRRIKRLYAAVGEIERQDLTAFPPQVVKSGSVTAWFQDFTGGLSEPQLENLAILAVQSVAHLRDPLRRWARQNGKNPQDVDAAIKQSDPLRLVLDLAEHAKHGGQRRDGGYSGKSPHLGPVERSFRLVAPPRSRVELQFGPQGVIPTPNAKGSRVVLSAPILDQDGQKVGDLDRRCAQR